jgi:predicted aspartyl protease
VKSRLLGIGLGVGVAFFAIASPSRCPAGETAKGATLEDYLKLLGYEGLEFEKTDHPQPFIDASLSNGRKPRFVVDTGWGISSLTPRAAHGLKTLAESGSQLKDPVLGTVTNEDVVLIDKLVLRGGTEFSNQPFRVRDIKVDFVTLPFDGVLGLDFLLRNFCLIDCWKQRLYVRASELSGENAAVMDQSLRLSGFSEVPLSPEGMLNLSAEINGHPIRLLVDTGAPDNMLDNSQLRELGLRLVHYNAPATGTFIETEATVSIVGTGAIGLHQAKVTKLDTLQLGTRQWKNVYFAVTDMKAWGIAARGTHREDIKGFLSQSFLVTHGALIDVSHRKLWLRASKAPPAAH